MAARPAKSNVDCPLWHHPNGQWCKKTRGKVVYFGTDQDAAINRYVDEKDALHAVCPKLSIAEWFWAF